MQHDPAAVDTSRYVLHELGKVLSRGDLTEGADLLQDILSDKCDVVYRCTVHATPLDCEVAWLTEFNDYLTDTGPGDVDEAIRDFLKRHTRECHA